MTSNLFINTLLSASLNSLWALMNGLQMIAHLPMFKVVFPANAQMILEPLVEVANFDLIPVWLFYPFIFNFGDSDAPTTTVKKPPPLRS